MTDLVLIGDRVEGHLALAFDGVTLWPFGGGVCGPAWPGDPQGEENGGGVVTVDGHIQAKVLVHFAGVLFKFRPSLVQLLIWDFA